MDGYIILGPIKRYKDKQNQKQIDFWNRTKINKKVFFNNLNYEVRKKYYSSDNIIDYDVIDYLSFEEFKRDNRLYVEVKASVRIVYYENNRIISRISEKDYIMVRNEKGSLDLKDGANVIKCYHCGSSIDVTKGKCEYCNSEIKYLQDWVMVEK